MTKSILTGCLLIVILLAVGLIGSGGSVSEAAPLAGITDTPTPTNTPTNTPTATPTNTPTVPTDTPAAPTEPSVPIGTATPAAETPVGTLTLPLTGHTGPTGLWLVLVVVGAALMRVAIRAAEPRAR
jgi:hypothetical protein